MISLEVMLVKFKVISQKQFIFIYVLVCYIFKGLSYVCLFVYFFKNWFQRELVFKILRCLSLNMREQVMFRLEKFMDF